MTKKGTRIKLCERLVRKHPSLTLRALVFLWDPATSTHRGELTPDSRSEISTWQSQAVLTGSGMIP